MRARSALVPLLTLAVLHALGGAAHAQDGLVDADTRWASVAPRGLTFVRGPRVPPHLDVLLGLDFDYVRRPLSVTDRAVGVRHDLVSARFGATLLWGIGLFDSLELALAFPVVLSQAGEGRSALTGLETDSLSPSIAGDLRLGVTWAIPRGLRGVSAATFATVSLPTGTETSLAGEPGVVVEAGATAELRVGLLRVITELAVRVRGRRQLGSTSIGTQVVAASAVSIELVDRRLELAVETRGLAGVDPGAPVPLELAVSARGRPGDDRALELSLAIGAGIDDAALSPAFRIVAGVRYTSPSRRGEPRASQPAP